MRSHPPLPHALPRLTVVLITVLAFSLLTPAALAGSPDPSTALQQRINAERARRGVGRLRVCSDLDAVAERWSERMARSRSLSHNPRLSAAAAPFRALAENVGYGGSLSRVHRALMNSAPHRRNLLSSGYSEVGVGLRRRAGIVWVTQVFRRPAGRGCARPAGPGVPLLGDWNGDGVDTPGRFTSGVFRLHKRLRSGGTNRRLAFGRRGDVPLVGDWNGDGHDTVGIRRGSWFILRLSNRWRSRVIRFSFGRQSDRPLVGDWNGDGRDTLGLQRGNRYLLRDLLGGGRVHPKLRYGRASDRAVVGDWNGDGVDTIGQRRGRRFLLRNAHRRRLPPIRFRFAGKGRPLAGDWSRGPRDAVAVVQGKRWRLRARRGGLWRSFSF
ncbi:MAG: CAP domain-containing protein [Egibacteraceae bacterium]